MDDTELVCFDANFGGFRTNLLSKAQASAPFEQALINGDFLARGIQAGKLSIKIVQFRSDFVKFRNVLSTFIVGEMKER